MEAPTISNTVKWCTPLGMFSLATTAIDAVFTEMTTTNGNLIIQLRQ